MELGILTRISYVSALNNRETGLVISRSRKLRTGLIGGFTTNKIGMFAGLN